MRLLISLLVLLSCNVTSKVPQQYDQNNFGRHDYYFKKYEYYNKKADSVRRTDDTTFQKTFFSAYYIIQATENIDSAKKYLLLAYKDRE